MSLDSYLPDIGIDRVTRYIKTGQNLLSSFKYWESDPIKKAIAKNDLNTLQNLDFSQDVNAIFEWYPDTDEKGDIQFFEFIVINTPRGSIKHLYKVAKSNLSILNPEKLITASVKLNFTLLHLAAHRGSFDVMKYLIEAKGANLNTEDCSISPLELVLYHIASSDPKGLKLPFPDLTIQTLDNTITNTVKKIGHRISSKLANHPNSKYEHYLKIAYYLIENGIELPIRDMVLNALGCETRVLLIAHTIKHGNFQTFISLIKDFNIKDYHAIEIAFEAANNPGALYIAHYLIQSNKIISIKQDSLKYLNNNQAGKLIETACKAGNFIAFEALSSKINIKNYRDEQGNTLYQLAATNGHIKLAKHINPLQYFIDNYLANIAITLLCIISVVSLGAAIKNSSALKNMANNFLDKLTSFSLNNTINTKVFREAPRETSITRIIQ
ncbi:MAG: ankyrin repeat domain-containing protein [Sphingobacteriia bacterium]|nr:ankyrin repeat domain-containing protein [Sphingobacteriia bacterium]